MFLIHQIHLYKINQNKNLYFEILKFPFLIYNPQKNHLHINDHQHINIFHIHEVHHFKKNLYQILVALIDIIIWVSINTITFFFIKIKFSLIFISIFIFDFIIIFINLILSHYDKSILIYWFYHFFVFLAKY